MLLTEETLQKAVRVFVLNARIPRPNIWTPSLDEHFVRHNLFPAFLEALHQIENVELCHGFDINNAINAYLLGTSLI